MRGDGAAGLKKRFPSNQTAMNRSIIGAFAIAALPLLFSACTSPRMALLEERIAVLEAGVEINSISLDAVSKVALENAVGVSNNQQHIEGIVEVLEKKK